MNTNGNTYTIIYSTVLVVLVAAILSIAAISLKPMQDNNVKVETISKILTAANLYDAEKAASEGNAYAISEYEKNIVSALIVNSDGEVVDSMKTKGEEIEFKVDLKSQYDLMKQMDMENPQKELLAKLRLPVYVFNVDGRKIRVVPCYGAGLWGPIWGYLAFDEDMNTVEGAVFDHKSETPGLGAEISQPKFYSQFHGKQIYDGSEMVSISVVKGGARDDDANGVDAISGGTITSRALEKTIRTWLSLYKPYFAKTAVSAAQSAGEPVQFMSVEQSETEEE